MDKKDVIFIVSIVVFLVVMLSIVLISVNNRTKETGAEVSSVEDLTNLLNEVYDGVEEELYALDNRTIDLSDANSVKSYTGLDNGDDLEFAVVSEPLINAQAYSVVMAKVKDGVNANEVAKEMSEKVDTRKWICVSADKLYATNSGDIVFLVMTNEEMAKSVYDSFKKVAGTVGQEYERTAEEEELPPDDVSFPVPEV